MPLLRFDRVSDEYSQSAVAAGISKAQSLRFCGDELNVLDGFVL